MGFCLLWAVRGRCAWPLAIQRTAHGHTATIEDVGVDHGGPAHLIGMAFVVEEDEAFDPTKIGFFGPNGVIFPSA